MPGLNHSHLHLICNGLPYNFERRREGVPSLSEASRMLKTQASFEYEYSKLKRIIGATPGFKLIKAAYATAKKIRVMRSRRKGQAGLFYSGHPSGEVSLVSGVFKKQGFLTILKAALSLTLQRCP